MPSLIPHRLVTSQSTRRLERDVRTTRRWCRAIAVLVCLLTVAKPSGQSADTQTSTDTGEWKKLDALFSFIRNRNARDYAVTGPDSIDEGKYVAIGGIDQWITIRGEDRKNPVLLLLHGGPGDATNLYGYATFRTWLKHFTVVQWDQRGAGKTFGKNGASIAPSITIDRMTQDGIELAELLRKSLGKEKIVLVGHSWGSILGVFMAKARPELFSAFVGTGQVGDEKRNYAVAFDALLKKAKETKNERAIRELSEVGPPPYSDGKGYGVQRKWANQFEGADMFLASMLGLALSAPGYSTHDVNDWLEGQGVSADRLVPQTRDLEAKALGGDFALPVFVIQGAEDFTTPTTLAREFVDSLHAPHKEFVPIEGGGHFAVFMKPQVFLNELVSRVVPLARTP
jgi:pimeloyl-ACP methyl ester carboxylesterase